MSLDGSIEQLVENGLVIQVSADINSVMVQAWHLRDSNDT